MNSPVQMCAPVHVELRLRTGKNDEFCIKNEELCIENEELCIENDGFEPPHRWCVQGRAEARHVTEPGASAVE